MTVDHGRPSHRWLCAGARQAIARVARPIGEAASMSEDRRVADLLAVIVRQLLDEARRNRRRPAAIDAAIVCVADESPLASPSEPDIGQPPLLLQACDSALVKRPLIGEQPLLPAG